MVWFVGTSEENEAFLNSHTKFKSANLIIEIMFYSISLFFLVTFNTLATSAQHRPQESGIDKASNIGGAGSRVESAVWCSEVGNCTCIFEKILVTVICTSAGDRLDEIASKLPQTTTHL